LCGIGKTPEDFIRQIEIALENPGASRERSEKVKDESWEARVEELREIIVESKVGDKKSFEV
jgi:hypothetical protein